MTDVLTLRHTVQCKPVKPLHLCAWTSEHLPWVSLVALPVPCSLLCLLSPAAVPAGLVAEQPYVFGLHEGPCVGVAL